MFFFFFGKAEKVEQFMFFRIFTAFLIYIWIVLITSEFQSDFLMTAVAKYSYEPQREDELRLTKGDVVDVLEKSSDGWWKGVVRQVKQSFCDFIFSLILVNIFLTEELLNDYTMFVMSRFTLDYR